MRIIAGEYGGRIVKAPSGRDTRPTTDRVRESMMSMIQSAVGFSNVRVLDAFAGSGVLGLEALSRGAASVAAFECDASALRTIAENVKTLGVSPSSYRLVRGDVFKHFFESSSGAFDVVFLDPPYAFGAGEVFGFLERLRTQNWVVDDTVLMYEHAANQMKVVQDEANRRGFEIVKAKKYGDTALSLIRVSLPSD